MSIDATRPMPFMLSVRSERVADPASRDEPGSPPAMIRGEVWPAGRRPTVPAPPGGGGGGNANGAETPSGSTNGADPEAPDPRTVTADEGTGPGDDFPDAQLGDSAIVILHGFKGFRRWGFFPHVAGALAAAGHTVVTFDFSRNGVGAGGQDFDELEAFARNTFTRELDETHQVVEALRGGALPGPNPRRVGLLGHSRGGGVAVLAAAELELDALVSWAAVATFDRWADPVKEEWRREGRIHIPNARTGQQMPLDVALLEDWERNRERLDIEAGAGRIQSPWLIVHGTADEAVAVEDAHRLARASSPAWATDGAPSPQGAEGGAQLELIEGAGHTFGAGHPFDGEGPHLATALEATRAHFDRVLARPR